MTAQQKTFATGLEHSKSPFIYLEYSDGSIRRVKRPRSVQAMDALRRRGRTPELKTPARGCSVRRGRHRHTADADHARFPRSAQAQGRDTTLTTAVKYKGRLVRLLPHLWLQLADMVEWLCPDSATRDNFRLACTGF